MASTSSQGSHKEYVVRIPKSSKKRYHMMRFNTDLGSDFFKSWTQCKIERENNIKEFKSAEETPKFGAGSEFGREQKEQARRIRLGINIKKYRPEAQPWLLTVGSKGGKKYKGIREGGVADNVAWYVFMQGKDGAFEAYPVDEWYNFQPINRYKALTAEEAELEFERRDKIMNYFQVMYEKKYKKEDADPDEDEGKKKGAAYKKFLLSEMDDWVSEEEDDDEDEDADILGDDDNKKKSRKKKLTKKGKKAQGGKKQKKDDEDSDNSCIEESDDYNEGAEHDYISSDSSDSDLENAAKATKDLAGVQEADALQKLLSSDEEDDEDKDKKKEKEEQEEGKEEEKEEEKKKKKKKKKKKEKKPENAESEYSTESSSDESRKKKDSPNGQSDRKKAVNEIKKRVKENPHEMAPQSKRFKGDKNSPSTSLGAAAAAAAAAASDNGVSEDSIRRYLMRKPMTTTELLQKFKSKKTGLNSEQLVQSIAQILKRVNPVKQMVKGKMYLSIKT